MSRFLNNKKLTRRTLMRGLLAGGVVTVGLPWLEFFAESSSIATAASSGFAPRFGLFFWGNGILPDRWIPNTTGPDWTLSDQLRPLEGVKDDVTLITGMEVKTSNLIPHGSGAAGILSGAAPIILPGNDVTFQAPSIDQVIAQAIGNDTRFRSVEFGAAPQAGLSYNGPNSLNPPESSPFELFNRFFGPGFREPGSTEEVDPTLALRRSVLDAVSDDIKSINGSLGAADKLRFEQHLEGVRALELRLARLADDPPNRAACMKPIAPEGDFSPVDGREQIAEKNRAMSDVIAMALACDQTRVFSNFITTPSNNVLFEGASLGHHQLTHDEPGDQPQVHEIVLQVVEQYAYLVEALRAIPEGDGTVLDNCVVLGTSEISFGRVHSIDEMPLLLAGSACGAIETGTHIRSESADNTNKLHLSVMRALGMNIEKFGTDEGETADAFEAVLT